MAYFTGKNNNVSIGGNTIPCIQSVESSEAMDVYMIECSGGSAKTKVTGLTDAKLTVNFTVEQDDVTEIGYVDPGDAGAIEWHPAGDTATYIEVTSTNGTVVNRTMSSPINGFFAISITVELDDISIGAAV